MAVLIGSARMYEWSPSLADAWRRLLEWVSARAEVGLDIPTADRPMPLEDLWARGDLGCVVMCGYPWALAQERPALLAAPVPSPARFGDRPVYVSDFVVRAESRFQTLEDTFGGRIAYSTEHSQSGYNAARHHLLRHRTPARPTLYAAVLGPFMRQRPVLEAIAKDEADVAAVDGYAFDLLRRHSPDAAARFRAVATTDPAPSPPMVASRDVDRETRERLTAALLAVGTSPELARTREALLLARFERVEGRAFEALLEWQRAAEAAGYPKLA